MGNRKITFRSLPILAVAANLFWCNALAQSSDVILGELLAPQIYPDGNIVFMGAGTTSCNAGNVALNWYSAPDNRHPVIALNLYKYKDGRMSQIGQSWLKHGIFALEHDICGFGCQPTHSGSQIGPGCSDPYGAGMNSGPNLGARSEVNPVTGFFDGSTANDHSSHRHRYNREHSLRATEADAYDQSAEYYIEGHYVTSDDAMTDEDNNNVSYRKINLVRDFQNNFFYEEGGLTEREHPAILAWPNSTHKMIDSEEAMIGDTPLTSRIIVANSIIPLPSGAYRYEYAVYNMNSERGIQSFTVPVGAVPASSVGFSAPKSYGEGWSNDAWSWSVVNEKLTWQSKSFEEDENANAIRWGTTYNFWFESDSPPTGGEVKLGKFKTGHGPSIVKTIISVPQVSQ